MRRQDKANAMLYAACHGKMQRNKILSFVLNNIKIIEENVEGSSLPYFLRSLFAKFVTKGDFNTIFSFFKNYDIPIAHGSICQGLLHTVC